MFIMIMGRIYEKLAVKLTDWGKMKKNCTHILFNFEYFRNAQNSI